MFQQFVTDSLTFKMKIEAIAQLNRTQIQDLHQLYQWTWWGKERTLPDIQKMLQNTDLIVGYCEVKTKKIVAFARVLTDYVYRAVIWDVIVAESYRKQGLGKALMEDYFVGWVKRSETQQQWVTSLFN